MCHSAHSIIAKIMVDNVAKIVGMLRWNWVLLLLLTHRVSVGNVTCVASQAI